MVSLVLPKTFPSSAPDLKKSPGEATWHRDGGGVHTQVHTRSQRQLQELTRQRQVQSMRLTRTDSYPHGSVSRIITATFHCVCQLPSALYALSYITFVTIQQDTYYYIILYEDIQSQRNNT